MLSKKNNIKFVKQPALIPPSVTISKDILNNGSTKPSHIHFNTDQYIDIGYKFDQMVIFFIPILNRETDQWCAYIGSDEWVLPFNEEIQKLRITLASGNAEDYAHYRQVVGSIQSLEWARENITDIIKKRTYGENED